MCAGAPVIVYISSCECIIRIFICACLTSASCVAAVLLCAQVRLLLYTLAAVSVLLEYSFVRVSLVRAVLLQCCYVRTCACYCIH